MIDKGDERVTATAWNRIQQWLRGRPGWDVQISMFAQEQCVYVVLARPDGRPAYITYGRSLHRNLRNVWEHIQDGNL